MRIDAMGPWNLERTLDYVQRLTSCMGEMPKPFGMLLVSHVQPILGPQGEAALAENMCTRVRLGCSAQATVLLDHTTFGVAQAQYRRVYIPAGLRYAIFDEVTTAARWLIDNGFSDVKGLQGRTEPTQNQPVSKTG